MAGRFSAAMEDDFGSVVRLLLQDKEREDNAEGLMEGESSRQVVTEQREELREAMPPWPSSSTTTRPLSQCWHDDIINLN